MSAEPIRGGDVLRVLFWSIALTLTGCGAAANAAPATRPQLAQVAPASERERVAALRAFAERAFRTLQTRYPSELVFDDITLRKLLNPVSAGRAGTQRNGMQRYAGVTPVGFELLRDTTFAGACFQALRDEPAGSLTGLVRPGWMFDRVLLVGGEPTGRVALWLEGEFLWTDTGFGAIAIDRAETPRRGHSDLELAVCDVDLGVHQPLDIVVDRGLDY